MKKIILRVLVAAIVLLIVAVLAIGLSLDGLVKRGVQTIGPRLTGVPVKLDTVNLSLLSGSGKLSGLLVGNPEGFKAPSSIQVSTASLSLKPGSVLKDKVIITSINLQSPEITFETDLKGNNLSKLLANVKQNTGGGATAKPTEPTPGAGGGKKLQVDDFVISGAKLHVSVTALGGQSTTVTLPEIHLTNLGTGPEGITPAELTQRVLEVIEKEALQASSGAIADLSKQATGLTKDVSKSASEAAEQVTKGLGGFLKK